MGVPATKRRYTIAEYLDYEEKSAERNEYHAGKIRQVPAESYRHCRISSEVLCRVGRQLLHTIFHPLTCSMRLRIPGAPNYVYADLSVLRDQPKFDPDDPRKTTIINPLVIFEVVSEASEAYDRGAKFELYRQIPTLQEYVLISQDQPFVESYLRRAKGAWLFNSFKGIRAAVTLSALKIHLPLREIYDGIEFEMD
jgi:Uma2 family endonuclease